MSDLCPKTLLDIRVRSIYKTNGHDMKKHSFARGVDCASRKASRSRLSRIASAWAAAQEPKTPSAVLVAKETQSKTDVQRIAQHWSLYGCWSSPASDLLCFSSANPRDTVRRPASAEANLTLHVCILR